MRDLIMKYGISFGKRYTPRQKKLFVKTMCQDLSEVGCQVTLAKHQGLLQKSTHILIQQPELAEKVIIANYDTPSRLLWGSCDMTPFDPQLNTKSEKWILFVQSVVSLLLLTMIFALLFRFSQFTYWLKIGSGLICCLLSYFIYVCTKGIANRWNYNRNSASVVLVRQLAQDCKNQDKIGFILMDRGCDSYLGFQQLLAQYPQLKEKEVVILESLAIGETLVEAVHQKEGGVLCTNKEDQLEIMQKQFRLEKANQTALGFFSHVSWLVSGTIENRRFVVKNTRSSKDYYIDLPRLEKLRIMLKKWAEKEEL